jgi:ribosomal protein S18 acetylase RimI-like enzyme
MTAEEFEPFITHLIEHYALDLSASQDMILAAAQERAAQQTRGLLPQGIETPGQVIYTIRNGENGERVGVLWVAIDSEKKSAWIYDIEIEQACRGRGFGRETLYQLEDILRQQGIRTLGLNVFGDNHIARHLYESLGFQPTAIQMRKQLFE